MIITSFATNRKPSNEDVMDGPKWRNKKSKMAAAAIFKKKQQLVDLGQYWIYFLQQNDIDNCKKQDLRHSV